MNDLLPCPFCGSSEVQLIEQTGIAWVQCNDCTTDGPEDDCGDGAVEKWNTRALLRAAK